MELVQLILRKQKGEDVDLAIKNKENQKNHYRIAKEELIAQIQKETNLTMQSPRFIGIARVVPELSSEPDKMHNDPEIEAIGMQFVLEYERNNGRTPEDVSLQNLGYDIRSLDSSGNIRYIEVKARATIADINLTPNEWFKAKHFGDDYFLYVVFNAATQPELCIIQNPAKKLNAEEKHELVRISVTKEEILNKSENL